MAKAAAAKAVVPAHKAPAKVAPGKSVAVAKKVSTTLATVDEAFEAFAGLGMENVTSKDLVIPRIAILQALSPQLDKQDAAYIKGAEAGNFCNVATNVIYEEMKVIPCFYQRVLLEWAPRESGQGLVHNHGSDSTILEQCEQDDKRRYFLPSGNQIIETMTFFCLDITTGVPERCFIPLSSTQLKNGRKWMTMMAAEKLARRDGSTFTPPMFFRAWTVMAKGEQNNQGSWYGWSFEAAEPIAELDPTLSLLQDAKAYYEQSAAGGVIADPSPLPVEVEDAEEM
jgi:hypothetical protein